MGENKTHKCASKQNRINNLDFRITFHIRRTFPQMKLTDSVEKSVWNDCTLASQPYQALWYILSP